MARSLRRRARFGSAVGLLIDSDNTGTEATSWFDDILLRLDHATGSAGVGTKPTQQLR